MLTCAPGIFSRKLQWEGGAMSVFHIAILNEVNPVIHYAIKSGCNIDEREHKSKMTAMHMACLSGNLRNFTEGLAFFAHIQLIYQNVQLVLINQS